MKAHALAGRDKPKDAYDICYCLDHFPGGMEELAENWRGRRGEAAVMTAIKHLQEKFRSAKSYGPNQVVEFYSSLSGETADMEAQRAFQLVSAFLRLIDRSES